MTQNEPDDGRAVRALVALGEPSERRPHARPVTDFLAQLIACNRRLPDYRPVRRTRPEIAALAYAEAEHGPPARIDRRI